MNKADILSLVPDTITVSKSLEALAESVSEQLASQSGLIDKCKIYAKIDELPESLLDILAKDFNVYWWSQYMSVDEKRNTLKSSWNVHRRLGTKGAVKSALASVYERSDIKEWFNYDGDPFHFKIVIDSAYQSSDVQKYNDVINRVGMYKNVRSYLDGIEYGNLSVTAKAYSDAVLKAYSVSASCVTINSGN